MKGHEEERANTHSLPRTLEMRGPVNGEGSVLGVAQLSQSGVPPYLANLCYTLNFLWGFPGGSDGKASAIHLFSGLLICLPF